MGSVNCIGLIGRPGGATENKSASRNLGQQLGPELGLVKPGPLSNVLPDWTMKRASARRVSPEIDSPFSEVRIECRRWRLRRKFLRVKSHARLLDPYWKEFKIQARKGAL
jgi:hypothetical protein